VGSFEAFWTIRRGEDAGIKSVPRHIARLKGERMKVLLEILSLAASFLGEVALGQSPATAPTTAQLIGTWKLISIEDTIAGRAQASVDLGAHPDGFLMYQHDGHMCAVLADGTRPAWKDKSKPTNAEKIAYYDTFIAYCGTFKVDSEKSIVYHYPTVAWAPEFVGSTQSRPFRLEGDRLIITVTEDLPDLKMEKRVLVWERSKPTAQ
jgi:hypothetical protein